MRIKDKKVAREHLANAWKALEALKEAQEALFDWGCGQGLEEAESPGEEAWNAVECLGDNLDGVEQTIDDIRDALDDKSGD